MSDKGNATILTIIVKKRLKYPDLDISNQKMIPLSIIRLANVDLIAAHTDVALQQIREEADNRVSR